MAQPTSRLKSLARLAVVLIVAAVAMQFVRPELPNPSVTAELQAPPEVKQIFRNHCYNCHSYETKLSWFDQPVPAYWLVVKDVREARKHVNFSEMGKLPVAQQQGTLFEAVSEISLGAMPLASYRRFHPGAEVTPEELGVLKNYLTSVTATQPSTPEQISAADAQYEKWIAPTGVTNEMPQNVAAAPNGIAFLPEYKNWRAISSTDRFDNHTIRQVLGNDVAVKAIAENHINPWPDGTAFAKVAWLQQADEKGSVRAGAFFQVEFMIRDSRKYADTLGWGWARWRGAELKPYGKDANFASECVGCHNPLRDTDHVFTEPIRGQQ